MNEWSLRNLSPPSGINFKWTSTKIPLLLEYIDYVYDLIAVQSNLFGECCYTIKCFPNLRWFHFEVSIYDETQFFLSISVRRPFYPWFKNLLQLIYNLVNDSLWILQFRELSQFSGTFLGLERIESRHFGYFSRIFPLNISLLRLYTKYSLSIIDNLFFGASGRVLLDSVT